MSECRFGMNLPSVVMILSATDGPIPLFYVCLGFVGAGQALRAPAAAAMLGQAVSPEHFGNAATWQSSAGQAATVGGPGPCGAW